jgi:hypothetical protein
MGAKKKKPVTPNTVDVKVKNFDLLEIVTDQIEELPAEVIQVRKSRALEDYHIVTKDPHQWAYIEGPDVPPKLSGAYTSYIKAEQALADWKRTQV